MTDDPLTILREAGIECPEVEEALLPDNWVHWHDGRICVDKAKADAAILALARLAAKYKAEIGPLSEIEHHARMAVDGDTDTSAEGWTLLRADLDARYEAEHDA